MGNEQRMMKIQGKEEIKKGVFYEVPVDEAPLGVGGQGTVRRGYMVNEKTGSRREVAIKFLFDDLPESAILRSEREANIRILHENLVEMIAFVKVGDDGDDLYGRTTVRYHVVSELLHGVMLLDMIDGNVEEKEISANPTIKEYYDLLQYDRNQFAIKIVRSILSGIMALHDNGYIHRDIDPSNIMITTDGKVKLIDLGVAKQIGRSDISNHGQMLTSTGQFLGKAAYASPELVIGDTTRQNETTDIYAVGIVLFQMITGTLPFDGSMFEVLQMQKTEPLPLSKISNKKLRAIVKKATEKNQADRYQTAAMFRAELDKLVSTPAATVTSGPVNQNPEKGGVASYLPLLATIICGLGIGVILALIS